MDNPKKAYGKDEIRLIFNGMNRGILHRGNCFQCRGGISLVSNAIKEFKDNYKEIPIINTGNFMPNYYEENKLKHDYILKAIKKNRI